MLDLIDIDGATVTIDAMGCQAEIASKIISKKALVDRKSVALAT